MTINIPDNISIILDKLHNAGYEAYLAGGCVRDGLMGREPSDYDITTNALPEQTAACFEDFTVIETGIKHGTVTVVSGGENVEITTYRIDGTYADHRRPDTVCFTPRLEDDLSRRDFTMNAMAYSPERGLVDKFGGQDDIIERVVRCVGDPYERFEEDALRILRALRFASELGFVIDAETARAIHEKKHLLKEISAERINSELTRFVTGKTPCTLMMEFSDVFSTIIPEITPCIGFDQKSRYHVYDVWGHIAHAVEKSKPDKYVRLALLFHDIAKPACCRTDDEGHRHFFGHEKQSAEMAEKIMERLHFNGETVRNVTELIKYHYVTPIESKRVVKRLVSVMGMEQFIRLIEVMKGDNRAKQSFCLERIPVLDGMKIIAYEIVRSEECFSLRQLAVNGNDIAALGISGRQIGETLDKLLSKVIDEELPNEKEALLAAAQSLQQ